MRPYLEYAIQANYPNLNRNIHHLKRMQRAIENSESILYSQEGQASEGHIYQTERRRNWSHLPLTVPSLPALHVTTLVSLPNVLTNQSYNPAGESPTPCNTASERFSSRAIWEKASPAHLLITGTQTPPSWPHPGLFPPPTPSWAKRAQITARTKPSLTQERRIFCSFREILLEQIAGASSLVTLSVYL